MAFRRRRDFDIGWDNDLDYSLDMGCGGFDEDEFPWDMPDPPPGPLFKNNVFGRPRYADAYGDYRGGYGPGGGFGPPSMFGPRPPPPLFPPPGFGRPMGPPPGLMRGRGYGTGGPPRKNSEEHKAIKFLMRCGVTKEHIKNLPRDVLMLIHPEHCGLCGMTFDTMVMSRNHYISKNHAKTVKKMLTKTHGGSATEMPIKSRELYCELCDIQITSKVHGDAHYAGKAHRGIVEGRKKPKNPLLLQPHMQWRFEQLIRREKRNLKSLKETADAEEGEQKPAKPQTTSSELYCDICKTTVTCSEQMTMHMNGKKHLAKEKHHILMMMKGDTADKDENQEDNNEEDEDENMDGNGEGEDGNCEGQDGNGEGQAANEQEDIEFIEEWTNEDLGNQDQTA